MTVHFVTNLISYSYLDSSMFLQLLRCLILISVLTVSVIESCANKHFAKKHECVELEGETCLLQEVPKMFTPVSQTPFSVIEVIIEGSILPVLNSTVCQAFPNTETFHAGGQQIQQVDPDAFTLCTKLRHLFLAANQISSLAPNTFKQNKRLTHLWLYMNELEELDTDLFENQRYLEHLYLSSNALQTFLPDLFRPLRTLKLLTLHNNELEELDAQELVTAMPYLKEVQIRFNQFDCKKLRLMLRIFEEHNIWLGKNGGEVDKYEYSYVKGFECAKKAISKKIYVKVCGCVIKEGPYAGKRKCKMQERNITVVP